MSQIGMVIIGAGEAGSNAALELRNQGWEGPITLIGKENRTPYERPPLSKSVMTSESDPSPTSILDTEKLAQLNIQYLSESHVVQIDRPNHVVHLENGEQIPYKRLLLATGASPRKLVMEGSDTSKAYYLRTFSDALAIRSQLQEGKHIAIIGGGFIGLEIAASARTRGCSVTLIEVAPRILMRGVPEEIANLVEARHRDAGVAFKLGIGITSIDNTSDDKQCITLADGSIIHCDTLIIGIGAIPETSLAVACGLHTENGICVDEHLATSDPDIYAAGDCCSFPHGLYAGRRIRLEAWRNAQDQGIHAAQNMLGAAEPYQAVPWFWSDQYDQTLQVAGLTDSGVATVKRESNGGNHLFFHLAANGTLAAASGIGPQIGKEIRLAEMLIEKQIKLDPEQLARADVKLKSLLNP